MLSCKLVRISLALCLLNSFIGDDMSFGMLWRFSIAGDESVDRYVIRDVDSRLNTRERLAVQDWIESGFPLHVMRDHPYHVAPIMGT